MICFRCGTAIESLDVYGGEWCARCLAQTLEDFKLKGKQDLKAPHKPVESDISEDIAWDAHCQRHHETEKALRTENGRLNLIIADLHAALCKCEMKASKNKHGVSTLDDTKAISSFSDDYEFLSNFYLLSLHAKYDTLSKDYQPIVVPSLEHAFQAAKATNLEDFETICRAETPGQAKKLGRKIKLRTDWDDVKLEVMEILLREKFSYPVLKKKLLATGEAVLVEGNTWGDRYWGVCEGVGENHLGRLLMKLRAELREAK